MYMATTKRRERTQAIETERDATARIAKEILKLETLERRWSSSLDFSDQAVWGIKSALEAAFRAGEAATLARFKPKGKEDSLRKRYYAEKVRQGAAIAKRVMAEYDFQRRVSTPSELPDTLRSTEML